jgi:hypothetical protein
MKTLPASIELTAAEEAQRLWKGARDAYSRAPEDVVSLLQALDLGIRAAEVWTTIRLRPVIHKYPATVASLLEESSPDLHIQRDAVHPPRALQFLDVIDVLAAEGLPCTSPKLHHGWEDPRFSCGRARHASREATGISLDEAAVDDLLLLLACRNRIFRLPPPVTIPADRVLAAFRTLESVVRQLSDGAND